MDKNITFIVTGCTGYVGNVLTKKLLSEGCHVVGLARSKQKVERVFPDLKPEIVYGDITNPSDIEKLFENGEKFVVIHTVAKVTIGEASHEELYNVTVNGTKNVVNACVEHNATQLLHISSTEALPSGITLDEDLHNYTVEPKKARKGYSRAKCEADLVVMNAVKLHNLNASLILLAGVLGPGDYSNSHMTQMFCDYIEGRLPASINGGYNDFDIRDVADVLFEIIEKSKCGESYIFANKPDKINDILSIIAEMTGRKKLPTLPIWTAYLGLPFLSFASKIRKKRPLYTASALASLKEKADFPIGKAVKEFGYSPRPLEETVRDHIQFLIDNGMVKV